MEGVGVGEKWGKATWEISVAKRENQVKGMRLLCIISSCMRTYNDLKIKQESDNVCAAWARTW